MIDKYRNKIDKIDKKLLSLLKKRLEISQEIALYKNENNLNVEQTDREEQILINLKKAETSPVIKSMIEQIWQNIFKISKKVQSIVINDE